MCVRQAFIYLYQKYISLDHLMRMINRNKCFGECGNFLGLKSITKWKNVYFTKYV